MTSRAGRKAPCTFLERLPVASRYCGDRVTLDRWKIIDAIVATPDQSDGVADVPAMQLGKHVCVQLPLKRTFSEGQTLNHAACRHKLITQTPQKIVPRVLFSREQLLTDATRGNTRTGER
jgi:hypothetical protein